MTPEELKIYKEEIKKSPQEGHRNAKERFMKELGLSDMVAAVAAQQCYFSSIKNKQRRVKNDTK